MVSAGKIILLPSGIHFNNYAEVIRIRGIGNAAFISLSRTLLGTFLTVLACAFLAYLMTQREMWGRRFWYRYIMITMYFSAGFIPVFMNIKMLGLLNNFLVYIIPGIISPFSIILVKTYIESLPISLQESAKIDGAGILTIFTRVMLPLMIPILATISIFAAVGNWNSYLDNLFYITKNSLYTLQYILFQYLNELNALASLLAQNKGTIKVDPALLLTPTAIRMTVTMVIMLPIFVVYPVGQRFFLQGLILGAVKG